MDSSRAQPRRPGRRAGAGAALGLGLCVASGAPAQVTLDGSIGPPVMPGTPVGSGSFDGVFSDYLISQDLGECVGCNGPADPGNLFHSFQQFDVPDSQSASFVDTAQSGAIANIIARVTGGQSVIDGTLRSQIAGASLFLLNPGGFLFGENSALDLSGSGYFSSAPLLRFPDPALPFDARETSPPVQLSADDPTHFGFLAADPSPAIELDLRAGYVDPVPEGATLAFVGGGVAITGEAISLQTITTRETLALAAVASVDADVPVDVGSFDVGGFAPGALGPIEVTSNAKLILSGGAGAFSSGRVVIRGGSFVLGSTQPGDVSQILACSTADCFPAAPSGVPARDLSVDVALAGGSDPSTADFLVESGGEIRLGSTADRVGDLHVDAPTIALRGKVSDPVPEIQSFTTSSASGPNLTLVGDEISIQDDGAISSTTSFFIDGDGGRIQLTADSVVVESGGRVNSDNLGAGTGATIGTTVGSLRVDGGFIRSLNAGTGPGGPIEITADEQVSVLGFGSISSEAGIDPFGFGQQAQAPGGDITVAADTIRIASADTPDSPNPSQISAISTANSPDADSGNVALLAREIVIEDGGQVITSTRGASDAGSIQVSGRPAAAAAARAEGELTPADLLRIEGIVDRAGAATPAGLFARTRDAGNAGSIRIASRIVEVRAGGEIDARAFLGSTGNAGSIGIEQAERVTVTSEPTAGGPAALSSVSVGGVDGASTGGISVQTDLLELLAGGQVFADTLGTARAGSILVDAREVEIDGTFTAPGGGASSSGLFSQSLGGAEGDGGDITLLLGERLSIANDGQVSVQASDGSFPGIISIQGSSAEVLLSEGGEISAQVGDVRDPSAASIANIVIDGVESLGMDTGSAITTETDGDGPGGTIDIRTTGAVELANGASITTQSIFTGPMAGDAGDVVIDTASLDVDSGATITAETRGVGAGGSIDIDVSGAATLEGGGRITSSTFGPGNAGQIQIDANTLLVDGGGLPEAQASGIIAETNGTGQGGTIDIATSRSTRLEDGGRISSNSAGVGIAGNVEVDAGRQLILTGGSSITTEAETEGSSGGNVTLRATDLVYLLDSNVSTTVSQGAGGGGDIGIPNLPDPPPGADTASPPQFLVLNRSAIQANAVEGQGGDIAIEAGTIFRSTDSIIESVAPAGIDGNVDISAPDSELAGQLTPLSAPYFDASEMMLPACAARKSRAGSFTIQTRAVQPPPDAPLPAALARGAGGFQDPMRGAACSS